MKKKHKHNETNDNNGKFKKNPQKDFKQSTTKICVKVGQKYKTNKGHFR